MSWVGLQLMLLVYQVDSVVCVSNKVVSKHFILLECCLYNAFRCVIVNIYGPNDEAERRECGRI